MSVSSQIPINLYVGNGIAGVFNFTFRLFNVTDLIVSIDGVIKDPAFEYTIIGGSNPMGGAVIFGAIPPVNAKIMILRKTKPERLVDYQFQGDFRAANVNSDFDRLWLIVQELLYKNDLAIKLSPNSPLAGTIDFPPPGAGKFIRWNATGDGLETADLPSVPIVLIEPWTPELTEGGGSGFEFAAGQVFDGGAGTAIVTANSLVTTTGFAVAQGPVAGLSSAAGKIGIYYRLTNIDIESMPNDSDLASNSGFIPAGFNLATPEFPDFGLCAVVGLNKGPMGVVTKTLLEISDPFGSTFSTSIDEEITVDSDTEFCLAFDKDAGTYGTVYFYTSEVPNTPWSYELAADHAPLVNFLAYPNGTSGTSIGIEVIASPALEHTGVTNASAGGSAFNPASIPEDCGGKLYQISGLAAPIVIEGKLYSNTNVVWFDLESNFRGLAFLDDYLTEQQANDLYLAKSKEADFNSRYLATTKEDEFDLKYQSSVEGYGLYPTSGEVYSSDEKAALASVLEDDVFELNLGAPTGAGFVLTGDDAFTRNWVEASTLVYNALGYIDNGAIKTWDAYFVARAIADEKRVRIGNVGVGAFSNWIRKDAEWKPENGKVTVLQDASARIKPGTITISAGSSAHAVLTTAIDNVFTAALGGALVYINSPSTTPALSAAFYYCEFTTSTTFTIFTAGAGSAAYNFTVGGVITGDTSEITMISYSIAASLLGKSGAILSCGNIEFTAGTSNKFSRARLNSSLVCSSNNTNAAFTTTGFWISVRNKLNEAINIGSRSFPVSSAAGGGSYMTTENTATASTYSITFQTANVTDNMVLNGITMELSK